MTLNVLAEMLSHRKTPSSAEFRDLAHRAGVSWHLRYPPSCRDLESIIAEPPGDESKNRMALQSAPAHFDAPYPQVGRAFKGHKAHHCWRSPI